MGTCLSVCFGADGQQGSHPPPPPAGQTNNNAQPSSPLTYAAAVGATALHGVANKLEQHAGANGGTAPPSWTKPPASKPGKGVKFTIRNAHVFKMPDGDTFTVDHPDSSTGQKVTSRIRILGIDCPETAQNFGPEAGEIGRKMAFKQNVTLHVHTTDQYGRLVADVVLPNGKNYGEEMLRKGAAWVSFVGVNVFRVAFQLCSVTNDFFLFFFRCVALQCVRQKAGTGRHGKRRPRRQDRFVGVGPPAGSMGVPPEEARAARKVKV